MNGSSIGTVKEIDGPKGKEEVVVDFPDCKEWVGFAGELEISRKPFSGEKVQVCYSSCVRQGWFYGLFMSNQIKMILTALNNCSCYTSNDSKLHVPCRSNSPLIHQNSDGVV